MRYDLAAAARQNHRRFNSLSSWRRSIFDGIGCWAIGLCGSIALLSAGRVDSPIAVPSAAAQDSAKVATVIGSCGSKAKPLAGTDLAPVLRAALIKELRNMPLIRVFEDSRNANALQNGYNIDGSVTQLSKQVNAQGDLEVSADVSLVISALPGRRVIGMVSGGATVIGSASVDTQFLPLLLQNVQQEAIQQAAHEAAASWVDSLARQRGRKNPKLVAMR